MNKILITSISALLLVALYKPIEALNNVQLTSVAPTWSKFDSPFQDVVGELRGVDAIDENSVWFVGYNYVGKFDGNNFITMTLSNDADLTTVEMLTENDGWTGGGNLFRWNGVSWNEVAYPFHESVCRITDIKLFSANDGWAVGYCWRTLINYSGTPGFVMRWNGTAWTEYQINFLSGFEIPSLEKIDGVNSTDLWIVGDSGSILHFDGTNWIYNPFPRNGKGFSALYVLSKNDVWFGGFWDTAHWNGSSLTSFGKPAGDEVVWGISMIDTNMGWAISSVQANSSSSSHLSYWNGSSWQAESLVPIVLNDIHMISNTSGWAVGRLGSIYRYSDISTPTPTPTQIPTSTSTNTTTASPTSTPSHTLIPTQTLTPTITNTGLPATSTLTQTPTSTSSPTSTPTNTPSSTFTDTPTPTPVPTANRIFVFVPVLIK